MKKQSLVGYLLTDFIYTFPGRAHFKECESFSYQISNQRNLDLYDLSEDQLIGKTVYDLKRNLMKDKWPDGFAESIDASDRRVVATKDAVNLTDKIFLDKSGALVMHTMVKLPVFNQQQDVTGVLTLSFDGLRVKHMSMSSHVFYPFFVWAQLPLPVTIASIAHHPRRYLWH